MKLKEWESYHKQNNKKKTVIAMIIRQIGLKARSIPRDRVLLLLKVTTDKKYIKKLNLYVSNNIASKYRNKNFQN